MWTWNQHERFFFSLHTIYIQGNPENVPDLNPKKTHGMVQLWLRLCVSVLYYVLE